MAAMDIVRRLAQAKVNFTLDVLGTREGYHMLDSLVCTLSLGDEVEAAARTDGAFTLSVSGEGSVGFPARSHALAAAEAFGAAFGTPGADLTLVRHIPVGGGLGSSSADAAGVLLALAELYHISDMVALKGIADGLGSDTGYLLTGGYARITGRGDHVRPLADLPPLWLLLVLPEGGVSTPACFRAYDEQGRAYSPLTEAAITALRQEGAAGAHAFGNALTAAAVACNPRVAEALAAARACDGLGAGMTGSGSACYAVFADEASCRRAQAGIEGLRTMCVRTM